MTLVAFLLLSVVYASAFEVDGINYSITNESLGYPSTNYTITDVNTTFVVDDICYRLIDNTTENVVEVTYGKKYAGKINIPTTSIYGGTQYAVKGIGLSIHIFFLPMLSPLTSTSTSSAREYT